MAVPQPTLAKPPRISLMPYVAGALIVVVLLFGGVAVWAVTTDIAGAVLARASVVVDSHLKKVQHPSGGIVGEIRVKNGDRVKTGDLLIRLDETLTRANLQIVVKQLDELKLRERRLVAERDVEPTLEFPAEYQARGGEPQIRESIAGELSLFRSRREANSSEIRQLRERIYQLEKEAGGLDAQRDAKSIEITLIDKELTSLLDLEERRLVTTAKMMSLRREAARLKGEHALLLSNAAQTRGRIAEMEIAIVQREQQFQTDVVKELREVQAKIAELSERKVAAEDQLARVEIRAPADGVVHDLQVFTVGGVINPSEPMMLIVPNNDRLVVEALVRPQDRDQIAVGAASRVRFAAFNQRVTPELRGSVSRIAADLITDQRTGESHYVVRISIPEEELAKLGDQKLVPGMPADVQITTEDRTALSYLIKPLEEQITRSFRER